MRIAASLVLSVLTELVGTHGLVVPYFLSFVQEPLLGERHVRNNIGVVDNSVTYDYIFVPSRKSRVAYSWLSKRVEFLQSVGVMDVHSSKGGQSTS